MSGGGRVTPRATAQSRRRVRGDRRPARSIHGREQRQRDGEFEPADREERGRVAEQIGGAPADEEAGEEPERAEHVEQSHRRAAGLGLDQIRDERHRRRRHQRAADTDKHHECGGDGVDRRHTDADSDDPVRDRPEHDGEEAPHSVRKRAERGLQHREGDEEERERRSRRPRREAERLGVLEVVNSDEREEPGRESVDETEREWDEEPVGRPRLSEHVAEAHVVLGAARVGRPIGDDLVVDGSRE